MSNIIQKQPAKAPPISNDLAAYIAKKYNKHVVINRPVDKKTSVSRPAQPAVSRNTNIRFVDGIRKQKTLAYQILFGELQNLLLSMNRNDAAVQRALVKLNDIWTRLIPELAKAEEYDEVIKS